LKTLIVVLNWNSREMTEQCIHSLLAMEGDSFSITAVDNGSRDGSVEYLRSRFPQIRVMAISRNVGFAAVWRSGTHHSGRHHALPSMRL